MSYLFVFKDDDSIEFASIRGRTTVGTNSTFSMVLPDMLIRVPD